MQRQEEKGRDRRVPSGERREAERSSVKKVFWKLPRREQERRKAEIEIKIEHEHKTMGGAQGRGAKNEVKEERKEIGLIALSVAGCTARTLGTCLSFSTSYPKLMRQALNSSGPREPPWSCRQGTTQHAGWKGETAAWRGGRTRSHRDDSTHVAVGTGRNNVHVKGEGRREKTQLVGPQVARCCGESPELRICKA